MSLETDLLIDRRRLKRHLSIWRIVAVIAAVVAALAVIGPQIPRFGGSYVARLNVSGIITDDRGRIEAIEKLGKESAVRALIVSINSPGGSVAGGEALHDAIAKVAETKPVVTVMAGTAASAGYMIAVPAARIFARDATLTGSIGVLLQTGEVSGLLDKLGVTATTIVSGPLKDQPSLTAPLSPAGREVLQGLVGDMYDQFVGMVASGRHMDEAAVRALADGRAFTGRQAVRLGLVDAIGGEEDARAWLAAERGVPASLPVRDVSAAKSLAARLAEGSFGGGLIEASKILLSQGLTLDGAWALWQPGRQ